MIIFNSTSQQSASEYVAHATNMLRVLPKKKPATIYQTRVCKLTKKKI